MIRHGINDSHATLPMGDDGKEKKPNKTFGVVHKNNIRTKSKASMMASPGQLVLNPRLFLAIACLWPLAILALFASSAPGRDESSSSMVQQPGALPNDVAVVEGNSNSNSNSNSNTHTTKLFELRKVLDRVDVMGYGPTHPRVAFVVVGKTKKELIASVESIFSNTDLNRIFVVCAVLDDGKGEDPKLVKKLRKIEEGSK